ncbi:hypothetical protein C2W62_24125 [Candidatus Entotheonella serta]|nr:hypothetical protein C2W62_24125 [Candidatus Entotheonella serta]
MRLATALLELAWIETRTVTPAEGEGVYPPMTLAVSMFAAFVYTLLASQPETPAEQRHEWFYEASVWRAYARRYRQRRRAEGPHDD